MRRIGQTRCQGSRWPNDHTMRRNLFILLFIAFAISSCHERLKDDGQTYNKKYVVGSIPSTDKFSELSKNEEELDSMFNAEDKYTDSLAASNPIYKEKAVLQQINDFKNNRARIFMTRYTNGNPGRGDSVLAFPCFCAIENDTLYMSMVVGFFGGDGLWIKLNGKDFESGYLTYTDDVKPYKTDLSDTAFYGIIYVNSRFQNLVINKKPTFKTGQQLSGHLTFTTRNYYEKNIGTQLDTAYVAGRLYFTCHTRSSGGKHRWGLD
jgi:hypothetical protein